MSHSISDSDSSTRNTHSTNVSFGFRSIYPPGQFSLQNQAIAELGMGEDYGRHRPCGMVLDGSMLIYDKAFQDADTHGIPLEIIMIEVHNRGLAVDLDKFYSDALLAGWSAHKAKARICEALQILRGDHISFTI